MLQRLFNRILFLFTLCVSIIVCSILWKKDTFRDTFASLEITYLPDTFWFIDVIFGWPMIVAITATGIWLVLQQFRLHSVIKKIKINCMFLLAVLMVAVAWLSIVYIPFYFSMR